MPSNTQMTNSTAWLAGYHQALEDAAAEAIAEGQRRNPKDGVLYVSEKIADAIRSMKERDL